MKNLLVILSLFVSVAAFSQLTGTDYVNVNRNGVERIIVEKFNATAIGAGYVSYKVYLDLATTARYQLMIADVPNGSMYFRTTGSWYNTPSFGNIFGEDVDVAGFSGFAPNIIYDSYVTVGGARSGGLGVRGGTSPADGFVAGSPYNTITTPGLNLSMFDRATNSTSFDVIDGAISYDPDASGGVQGPTAANEVLVGQFTTNGDFTFRISLQVRNVATTYQISGLTYSSVPNQNPTVAISAPVAGTTVNKNATVALAANASDVDGTVSNVEFFVNGVSVGSDNSAPFTGSWIALGTTANITAVATDNDGAQTTSAPISISISDPNPTTVALTAPVAGSYNLNQITLTANASDADQAITLVEFLVAGVVVGTDATAPYAFAYTPAAGTVSISARATNVDNESVVSSPVQVTFANGLPTLSITNPASFPYSLSLGSAINITAVAADVDGTIQNVQFLINGSVVATDATAPYEYSYSTGATGSVTVSARATDNNNAVVNAAGGVINNIYVGTAYLLESVSNFCSEAPVFCMPVMTPGAVTGVIGYDFELVYDAAKVTPTGAIIVSEELIADRDWVSYNMNIEGDSLIRGSVYFNGSRPQNVAWTGNGQVFCVEFSKNFDFGTVDTAEFRLRQVTESRANGVTDIASSAISLYTTQKETEFHGSLSFWADNSPIGYKADTNLITNIYGNLDGTQSNGVQPNANGLFNYNIANGTSISIVRNSHDSVDVQEVISAYDAYLASRVAVRDGNFRPNVFQIIAMDVTRDGRIQAGDATQISQRAVGQLAQFATDWVWVPKRTYNNNFSYRISDAYPQADANAADGIGYYQLNVPVPADVIALPIEDPNGCPVILSENYYGILVGDVTGNYAAMDAHVGFKSAQEASITLSVVNNTIEVIANEGNAIDLQLKVAGAVKVSTSLQGSASIVGDVVKLAAFGSSANAFVNAKVATIELTSSVATSEVTVLKSNINEVATAVSVVASAPSSINAVFAEALVFPNPSSTVINVTFEGVANVSLVNMAGQMVETQKDVNGSTSFDVSNLPAGNYTILVGNASHNVVVVK